MSRTLQIFLIFCFICWSGVRLKAQDTVEKMITVCKEQGDVWYSLPVNQPAGEKTIVFDYIDCPLDVSRFVYMTIDVKNESSARIIVDVQYKGPQKNHMNQGRFFVTQYENKQIQLVLTRKNLDEGSPWLPAFDKVRGLPGGYVRHWNAFDLDDVKKVVAKISWEDHTSNPQEVMLSQPYGTGDYLFPSLSFEEQPRPILDEMGQYACGQWEMKLNDVKELVNHGVEDIKKYINASFDPRFSQYGGWKDGPRMQATGRFYTAKYQGKWWLVDPEGYLFWSQGVTGVGGGSATSTKNREVFFPEFRDEKKKKEWPLLKEEVKNDQINFYNLNLKRKYGGDWEMLHAKVSAGRMKSWGLNTYGAWSRLPQETKHPYTIIIHPKKQGIGSIEKMVDPFSAEFRDDLKSRLESIKKFKGDPWNVGIFVNNELHWKDEKAIPNEVLGLDNSIPARKAFEDFLKRKYKNIEKLNNAWGSDFTGFESINSQNTDSYNPSFDEDMADYLDFFADTYYRLVAEAVHKAMPDHLYLGSRLHGVVKDNKIVQHAASRYCDVVSYNIYEYSVKDFKPLLDLDKPCIVGEFHFGAGSHGVWGVGLRSAFDLENQAELYLQYVKDAASHTNFVGAHWFQWSDQPATGRDPDGENFRIGLVNITDQPYRLLTEAIGDISKRLYQIRMKEGSAAAK